MRGDLQEGVEVAIVETIKNVIAGVIDETRRQ